MTARFPRVTPMISDIILRDTRCDYVSYIMRISGKDVIISNVKANVDQSTAFAAGPIVSDLLTRGMDSNEILM